MKDRMKLISIPLGVLVIELLLTGCASNRGQSLNGIHANFRKDSTNAVARISTDTNGVITAEVIGAESVLIGGKGDVSLRSLFAITAFRGAKHNRTDLFGGNVETSASEIETDPDGEAIGQTGGAIGSAISNAIKP